MIHVVAFAVARWAHEVPRLTDSLREGHQAARVSDEFRMGVSDLPCASSVKSLSVAGLHFFGRS